MILNLTERDGLKRQGPLTRLSWLSPSLLALAVLILLGAAPAAKADSFNFSLANGINTIAFSFPTTTGPSQVFNGYLFEIDSVPFTVNGASAGTTQVSFWNAALGGGLVVGDFSSVLLNQGGAQLYTGSESSPTFQLGTYSLTNWGGQYGGNFTLTLTDPPGTVGSVPTPEPSSLLLLGVGLLSLGGLIAYQQKKREQPLAEAGPGSETVIG